MTKKKSSIVLPERKSQWYKDAIFYELRVRSFNDSNGDGIGDFEGLTQKLDYLQDLGVTTLWLLPFYPSPMKDDGYDIADYTNVDPACGTLNDFRTFLREAHSRGLQVVTELVLNHTSNQHAWFERARRDKPGGPWRDFYVWSDTPEKYKDSRIIFKDFESSNWAWDPVAKAYYWHRFFFHQPDLNFDNPAVRKAMLQVVDFWLDMGVDGLRLDAVPYLIEREGTSCENLPETHAYLKELRAYVDKRYPNRMLLAEANQWPEDAAAYFGQGDECHMAFHFPIMPRLFMALHMEDRFPIIDILDQTPAIPATAQWAIFLRNHDELTLEMVTEEERDYMYRVYALEPQARINLGIRHRLAPLLGNDRKKIELMNGLLMSLPGTPVIYYGDEIGMGDNIFLGDRNGVRTPMQWSADRNAGFSSSNPQRLILPIVIDPEYHYEAFNVDSQQRSPHSLLWWMKRLIAMRKQSKAFGQGSIEFLSPKNSKVLAFIRQHEESTVLVVANLSRYVQYIELGLERFDGKIPVEMFGRNEFPKISTNPYLLTLGPHAFYWFTLEKPTDTTALPVGPESNLPELSLTGDWTQILESGTRNPFERLLPSILSSRRWFSGKARRMKMVRISEQLQLIEGPHPITVLFLSVDYIEGASETYNLPVVFFKDDEIPENLKTSKGAIVRLKLGSSEGTVQDGVLFDAFYDPRLAQELLGALWDKRTIKGDRGTLRAIPTPTLRKLATENEVPQAVKILGGEQSNTSLVYDDKVILKLFRRLEEGINPDLEVGRFLTDDTSFASTPPVAGYLEYVPRKGEPTTLAILHGYVPNQGSAWDYTLGEIQRYLELALTQKVLPTDLLLSRPLLAMAAVEIPPTAKELVGNYLPSARIIGQRTAEMHVALASRPDDPAFQPETFTPHYQWGLYQGMRSQAVKSFTLLRDRMPRLKEEDRALAARVLELQPKVQARLRIIADKKFNAKSIRTHGDYHLGQVLYTGKDFAIIDFEGEPSRPISTRRIKRSPLRDVAGMLRSFHYASQTALSSRTAGPVARPEDRQAVDAWALVWYQWVSATFLKAYMETISASSLLPTAGESVQTLLNAFLLEKALYEVSYELNNRPDWTRIPLQGILQLMESDLGPNPTAPTNSPQTKE